MTTTRTPHLNAGDYITDEKRLLRVLADTNGGIEAEDEVTGAIVHLTMLMVLRDWRAVTPDPPS